MARDGDNAAGAFLLLLILGAFLLYYVVPFLYAAFAFAALVLTLISLFAWNRPRRFFHLGIVPMQARAMVSFGIVGAILAPSFVLFTQFFLGVSPAAWLWPHFVIIGYTYGCIHIYRSTTFDVRNVDIYEAEMYAALAPPSAPPPALPAPTPFKYADWTDAEVL